MNNFTRDELRRAVVALDAIERTGDPDEWAAILREARDSAPSADPWQNVGIGTRTLANVMAKRLAGLLGVPITDCLTAAGDVYGMDRGRAVFEAMLAYADEVTGKPKAIRLVASTEGTR